MPSIDEHPVLGVLDLMRETVTSKANDYADDDDVYSNFGGAAYLAGVTVEQAFMVLIGVKVERLRQLMSGKIANHESIDDTLLDLANYAALLAGWRMAEETEVKDVVTRVMQGFDAPLDLGSYEREVLNGDQYYERKEGRGYAGDPV